jgi:hypothetical protein
MKFILKALKQSKVKSSTNPILENLNSKRLAPNIKTIKKQDTTNFEDYIDDVFKSNPHLDEKEMFDVYHDHKKVYDTANLEKLRLVDDKKNLSDLLAIKEKLANNTDEKQFKKLVNEFLNISSKISKK